MNVATKRTGLSFAALLATAVSLHAIASPMELPAEQTVGIASFTSGGIGADEADGFKAAFDRYPLVIELFEHGGAHDQYTADANVKIVDHKGETVLDERADGPFMLVRLPAGEYRVAASLKGYQLPVRHVRVTSNGHERAVFVWPGNVG